MARRTPTLTTRSHRGRRAAWLLVLAVCAGCSDDDGPPAAATGTPFERPDYRFVLPEGWQAALDEESEADDDPEREQVSLKAGEAGVFGEIFRTPAREPVRVALQRLVDPPPANQLEATSVERYSLDVGGAETSFVDATFDGTFGGLERDDARFDARYIGFEHGGSSYLVQLRGPRSAFDDQAEALQDLLESWKFSGR